MCIAVCLETTLFDLLGSYQHFERKYYPIVTPTRKTDPAFYLETVWEPDPEYNILNFHHNGVLKSHSMLRLRAIGRVKERWFIGLPVHPASEIRLVTQ
jgi:hypothetical protein